LLAELTAWQRAIVRRVANNNPDVTLIEALQMLRAFGL